MAKSPQARLLLVLLLRSTITTVPVEFAHRMANLGWMANNRFLRLSAGGRVTAATTAAAAASGIGQGRPWRHARRRLTVERAPAG
jgi:hypothetical protein